MSTEKTESFDTTLFDDEAPNSAASSKEVPDEPEDEAAEDTAEDKGEGDDTGEEESETPSDEEEEDEGKGKSKTDKMIPESRLKAAINDLTQKHQQELAELKAQPAPDPKTDPEGADLHYRIETSKAIMRDAFPDYNEKIAKYQEMVKTNPELNKAVSASSNPAKFAYDLAARQIEIEELQALKNSPDFDEFQKWKKDKAKAEKKSKQVDKVLDAANKGSKKPPNLNRATDVSKAAKKSSDDDLFADAPLDKTSA